MCVACVCFPTPNKCLSSPLILSVAQLPVVLLVFAVLVLLLEEKRNLIKTPRLVSRGSPSFIKHLNKYESLYVYLKWDLICGKFIHVRAKRRCLCGTLVSCISICLELLHWIVTRPLTNTNGGSLFRLGWPFISTSTEILALSNTLCTESQSWNFL